MGKAKTTTKSTNNDASSADALAKYEKAAAKLKPERVQPCRADVALAFANCKTGVTAVFGEAGSKERGKLVDELAEALPKLSAKKVLELPEIGRALLLAAKRVAPASTGEIDEKLGVVSKHREAMLDQAEVLAKKGLLDKGVVAGIRAGSGKLDMAQDGIALVDLYAQSAAKLAGKHPFADADFAELRAASEWLVERLTPAGARKAPVKSTEAEDLRDRLWTMVVERYSDLRVFGYYRFRDELDAHVPKLLSRALGSRDKGRTEETQAPANGAGATGASGQAEAG